MEKMDLNTGDGRVVLAELVQLLLHVAEDDGARRRADRHGLRASPENVLVLPLEREDHSFSSY